MQVFLVLVFLTTMSAWSCHGFTSIHGNVNKIPHFPTRIEVRAGVLPFSAARFKSKTNHIVCQVACK